MSGTKRALIIGINGMDGSHLADVLLERGYEVHGTTRRSSVDNCPRIGHLLDRVVLHRADLSDPQSIEAALVESQPEEVYNEADQDHVGWSKSSPAYSQDVTCGAVQRTLESIRTLFSGECKFFQPLSSTMFGEPKEGRQNEWSEMDPRSPYAVAKVGARYWCEYYRKVHDVPVTCAILYTHTSERQVGDYLLHKIAQYAVSLSRGKMPPLRIGNIYQRVDVGWAPQLMHRVAELVSYAPPDTYVVGTGVGEFIAEVVDAALHEAGVNNRSLDVCEVDPEFYQENPPHLVADTSKAERYWQFRPDVSVLVVVRRLVKHYKKVLNKGDL